MLFAKRTAIIERSFLLPQPIPLKVSLSVWYCVSSIPFSLSFPLLFYFRHACFFFLFLSFSLSPHFILVAFVTFSLSVLVFSCSFVSLSLPLSAAFFFLGSCLFAHRHRHTHTHTHANTDINKSPFCEVPEVRERM